MPSKKAKPKKVTRLRSAVNQEQVAMLAYELFLSRGGEHGHDREDWLTAERLLLEEYERKQPKSKRATERAGKRVTDERLRFEDKFLGR